jgi:hypothetical protein
MAKLNGKKCAKFVYKIGWGVCVDLATLICSRRVFSFFREVLNLSAKYEGLEDDGSQDTCHLYRYSTACRELFWNWRHVFTWYRYRTGADRIPVLWKSVCAVFLNSGTGFKKFAGSGFLSWMPVVPGTRNFCFIWCRLNTYRSGENVSSIDKIGKKL